MFQDFCKETIGNEPIQVSIQPGKNGKIFRVKENEKKKSRVFLESRLMAKGEEKNNNKEIFVCGGNLISGKGGKNKTFEIITMNKTNLKNQKLKIEFYKNNQCKQKIGKLMSNKKEKKCELKNQNSVDIQLSQIPTKAPSNGPNFFNSTNFAINGISMTAPKLLSQIRKCSLDTNAIVDSGQLKSHSTNFLGKRKKI